jgi:hypothetical protein
MHRIRMAVSMGLVAMGLVLGLSEKAAGQFGIQVPGGVWIDPEGIVRNLEPEALEALAAKRREALGAEAGGAAADLRRVSLARIVAAVEKAAEQGKPVPPEVAFLGGLERITHLFVDPEGNDIILAGPADRISVAADGTVVGAASKRPLLQLEDFVVALRAIDAARQGGILCSIDPEPAGITRLQAFLGQQKTIGRDPQAVMRGMEQALGPQAVRVAGVPGDSRFARVLVSADFRMKRIGMGLEESGVAGLPSYLSLVPAGGRAASLPRFWLEAEYEPLARDPDELAWRINGRRMKCLTENNIAGRGGIQRGAAGRDQVAEKWCAAMTDRYEALAAKRPVFAELVNCIDLAVAAALLRGRQLDARAGLDLGILLDPAWLPAPAYEVPKSVPTVATGIKKGTNWVLSASGGVQFQPWQFAAEIRADEALAEARTASLAGRAGGSLAW